MCCELYCWLVECGGFECLLVDVWRCGGWTAPWIRLLQCGLCDTCGSAFSGCDPALVAFYSVLWILTKILCNILLGTSSMVKLLWELRIFLDIHVWLSIEWLTFYRWDLWWIIWILNFFIVSLGRYLGSLEKKYTHFCQKFFMFIEQYLFFCVKIVSQISKCFFF